VDKFLHTALVLVNAYLANFNFLAPFSFGDIEEIPDKNWGMLISPDAP